MKLSDKINKTDQYEVLNYGRISKCAQKKFSCSYWDTAEYMMAMNSKPDIVTIMLGTNDAYEENWNEKQFRSDYLELANRFKQLSTNPKIYLMIPPPIYAN